MKVIKLYLKYQLTLSNVLILLFLLLFLSISYFISCYDINDNLSYDEILKLYFENSLYYTKIIIIFISCFLFMKLKNERYEYLINIVITAGYSKKSNYIGMIFSNIICIIAITTILFFSYILIGYINIHFFELKIIYLLTYFNLIILSICYGLTTYLIIQITNNQMIYIMVIIMFILSDLIINTSNKFRYFYLYFFPNLNINNGSLFIKEFYIIINIVLLFIVNLIVYLNKDLRG